MPPCRFSLIVPCYNVENDLPGLLDSLARQDFADFEVLLLDDGSTDRTAAIARQRAEQDSRYRFFLEKHFGTPARLRNAGFRNAVGEYIWCVDSDDEIAPGALAELDRALTANGNPDILAGRFAVGKRTPDGNLRTESVKFNFDAAAPPGSGQAALARLNSQHRVLTCNGYGCVIARRLLLEHDLFQIETLSLLEDHEWLPRVLFYASSVGATDRTIYYYIRRAGSVSTGLGGAKLKSVAGAVTHLTDFYTENFTDMSPAVRRFWSNHAANAFCWYFFNPMYQDKFTAREWRDAWRTASPFANAPQRRAFRDMLKSAGTAKRLMWPLLRLADLGWAAPARMMFRFYYRFRG